MKSALLVAAAALLIPAIAAADGARIVYSKSFPGSSPAYVEIAIGSDGAGVYKEDPKDDDPLTFQLSAAETQEFYSLAKKLDYFGHKLESGLKVAKMGMKTFRYEGSDGPREVKFNYSEDPDAKALTDLFEQVAESERAYINLERVIRFDKLGTQDAILQIETLRDQKRLLPATQFLPLLDRVAKTESFVHIARERAAALADSIRGLK